MIINSIFSSINGEVTASHQGSLCTFIRLAGCNLRCRLCDTIYAQDKNAGKEMQIREILGEVEKLNNINITITGGEPLTQKEELKNLCEVLYSQEFAIAIETNGAIEIPDWPYVDCWVADWKTPSSGMRSQMEIANFRNLDCLDFIKFVIETKNDFEDALQVIKDLKEIEAGFAFSPSWGALSPEILIQWMKEADLGKVGAIMSWQIHKAIDVL